MNNWKIHKQLKKILTKQFLVKEYIKNKKTTTTIAKEIGCGHNIIYRTMMKFKIKTRPKGGRIGENSPCFKTGKIKDRGGYILISSFYHPNKNNANYVFEHRLVMEAFLNKISYKKWVEYGRNGNYPKGVRFLTKKEIVHHINGVSNDNRIENLMLFPNYSAHRNFKHLGKKLFICKFCGKNQKITGKQLNKKLKNEGNRAQKTLNYIEDETKIISNTMLNYPKTRKTLIKQLIILKKAYQILRKRVKFD